MGNYGFRTIFISRFCMAENDRLNSLKKTVLNPMV